MEGTRLLPMLALSVFCAAMGIKTGQYIWNLGVTLLSGLLVLVSKGENERLFAVAALLFSAVGDYFMAHKQGSMARYALGICGFLAGHDCFSLYALRSFSVRSWAIAAAVLLLLGYSVYLYKRILPNVPESYMKAAICAYMLFSLCAMFTALSRNANFLSFALYALGIVMIVFSDTVIAETDFAGTRGIGQYIMPTYYACHILVTAGILLS